jgi:hypothetical protein
MQSFSVPTKLRVPLWSWAGQIGGLIMAVFFLGFSIWLIGQAKHPVGWSLFVIILFGMVIAGVIGIRQTIIISGTTVTENGLERKRRKDVAFYRWEDVVRYEPYRLDFALFFKNGERIRFPAEAKDFKEIKSFVLEKLEQIGTFEDGRKVPRVLPWSISIKTLVWILVTMVLVIIGVLVVKFARD